MNPNKSSGGGRGGVLDYDADILMSNVNFLLAISCLFVGLFGVLQAATCGLMSVHLCTSMYIWIYMESPYEQMTNRSLDNWW